MFIGVDTHKKTHTFVGIDDYGQTCGTRTVANTPHGWTIALRWVREHGDASCWGIENTGSLGKGFAQFLLVHGETDVREVSPQRTAQYRRRGRTPDKTDWTEPHDAGSSAATILMAKSEEGRTNGPNEARFLPKVSPGSCVL